MSKDQYRRIAGLYDTIFGPLTVGLRAIGMKMYPAANGMRVLDIGCGTGAHLSLYQEAGCEVFGIDPSPAMLEVARKRLGDGADLRSGDAANMPFDDAHFDLVTAMLVLHELPPATRSAILSEAMRTLKPDGRLLLIDFHPGPVRGLRGWQSKAIITLSELLAGREHYRNYRQFMAQNGLPSLVAAHDLKVDKERIVAGGNFGLFLLHPN